MRRKFGSKNRVIALALAFSMVFSEAAFAEGVSYAGNESDEAFVMEEANETEAVSQAQSQEEVVSDNTASVDADQETLEEVKEPESEAKEEQTQDEESFEVSADLAYDGSVSRVIGLEGSSCFNSETSDQNGNPIYYSSVKRTGVRCKIVGTTKNSDKEAYYDKATGLYRVNGKYYTWLSKDGDALYYYEQNEAVPLSQGQGVDSEFIQIGSSTYRVDFNWVDDAATNQEKKVYYYHSFEKITTGESFDTYDQANQFIQKSARRFDGAAVGTGKRADYYVLSGKLFTSLYAQYLSKSKKYVIYGGEGDEISLTQELIRLTWNELTTENIRYAGDQPILIGYQVEENGTIVTGDYSSNDGVYSFTSDSTYYSRKAYAAGQKVTYRVRGLYYTKNNNSISVLKVGEWSDALAVTVGQHATMPAVSGFTASLNGSSVDLKWNSIESAASYTVRIIKSSAKVPVTASNWDQFYKKNGSAYNAFQSAAGSTLKYEATSYYANTSYLRVDENKKLPYMYFEVRVSYANNMSDYYRYYNYSSSAGFDKTCAYTSIVCQTAANVPAISDFELNYTTSGYELSWKPVDATIALFFYEKAKFPDYYTTSLSSISAKKENSNYLTGLSSKLSADKTDAIHSVCYTTVSGIEGKIKLNNLRVKNYVTNDTSLEIGKTYYVVARTYDDTYSNQDRTAIVTMDGVAFTRYADFGPETKVLSFAREIDTPSVYSTLGEKSITLTMINADNATGFEIYKKKVGAKKYTKLVTTTDWQYKDTEVKKGTKYSYKVRAYYYNPETKRSAYSKYVYETATAGSGKNIVLKANKKSSTSVSLSWTKVAGVTKYEIYRCSEESANPSVLSKKYDSETFHAMPAYNAKYELIKTITKASTVKYTDKKLVSGEGYSYRIVAYYKEGKKVVSIFDEEYIYLGLDCVRKLTGKISGTKAIVSWAKSPGASKYEVSYKIYNPNGNQAKAATYTTTKKTSVTISNIPQGGHVNVSVRAYGKLDLPNGKTGSGYSGWASETIGRASVSAPTSVKATNVKSNGRNAVKISWKAVKGAAYYRVYRSTKGATYNADVKKYYLPSNVTSIVKEANDDESTYYNEVVYRMYNSQYDTITGTSVIDGAKLDSGVKYYYYVVAYDANDQTTYMSADDMSTAVTAPGTVVFNMEKPTIKKAKTSKGKVTLTIAKVTGAKSYTVYRSTKKKSGFKKIGSTKKTTYTDKKAKKGKTYYYKVEASGTNALKATVKSSSSVKTVKVK